MKFEYENQTYAIDFYRKWSDIKDGDNNVISRTPYTTVTIKIVEPEKPPRDWAIYRTATVGKWKHDKDTKAAGRLHALRSVTGTIPRGMKPILWRTYIGRVKGN